MTAVTAHNIIRSKYQSNTDTGSIFMCDIPPNDILYFR